MIKSLLKIGSAALIAMWLYSARAIADNKVNLSLDNGLYPDGAYKLEMPLAIVDEINNGTDPVADAMNADYLRDHAANKLYYIDASGTPTLSLVDGRVRIPKPPEEAAEIPCDNRHREVLARLYSEQGFSEREINPIKFIQTLNPDTIFKDAVMQAALSDFAASEGPFDSAMADCISSNLALSGQNYVQILAALDSLQTPNEKYLALYTLANMKDSSFAYLTGPEEKPTVNQRLDLEHITAELLFQNIKYSLAAREAFPYSTKVSDSDFLRFVSQYRLTNEPLQRWRRHLYQALSPAMHEFNDIGDAVTFVNQLAGMLLRYPGYQSPEFEFAMDWTDQGIFTMLLTHEERCEGESNLASALCYSIGIPLAHIFIPGWPDQDNNHAWNGFLASDGILYSIMGCEPDPARDPQQYMHRVFGKVYMVVPEGIQDVTSRFTPVADITAQMDLVAEGLPAYLNVVNSGGLRALAKESINEKGQVLFRNVGCRRDLLYTITYKPNTTEPMWHDLDFMILHRDGTAEWLPPNTDSQYRTIAVASEAIRAAGDNSQVFSLYDITAHHPSKVSSFHGFHNASFRLQEGHVYMIGHGKEFVGRPFYAEPSGGITVF